MLSKVLSAFIIFAAVQASAAEIHRTRVKDGFATIYVTGRLVEGDQHRFSLMTIGVGKAIVDLNSPGGRALVAMAIGEELRRNRYTTRVGPNTVCASSCGLVWLAGIARMAYPTSKVGFHSVFTFEADGPKENAFGNMLVAGYLRNLGFGDDVVKYATSAPPKSMEWLNAQEALDLGVSIDLRPD